MNEESEASARMIRKHNHRGEEVNSCRRTPVAFGGWVPTSQFLSTPCSPAIRPGIPEKRKSLDFKRNSGFPNGLARRVQATFAGNRSSL